MECVISITLSTRECQIDGSLQFLNFYILGGTNEMFLSREVFDQLLKFFFKK